MRRRADRVRRAVTSYRRRRIDLPVGPDDLVVDVGSGDRPHWRADVLVDRWPEQHGHQRASGSRARVDRPLFVADAADLPFADGAFDYSICSHVLEHVVDPAAAVAELNRVSRGGYVEVPDAASAKILDFPTHLWWVRRHGDTLVFEAKADRHFDPEIGAFVEAAGIEHELAALLDRDFDRRVIGLRWSGRLDVRVEGTPSPALLSWIGGLDDHHDLHDLDDRDDVGRWRSELGRHARRALERSLTLGRADRRRRPVRRDDVVAPHLRRGDDEVLRPGLHRA